jgi:N-acetylglucosamine-6-phosphate deacetylase
LTVEITARHFQTGRWVRFVLEQGRIEALQPVEAPADATSEDLWVAPAFWDIQTNGRWGVSFSSEDLTVEQVAEIVRAHAELGIGRLCPTLITAPVEATEHGVRTIAQACERWPEIGAMVVGIHLEGPWISHRDGYRGAHPLHAVQDPSVEVFERFQRASGNRVVLVTLAPEREGAIPFIKTLANRNIVVAIGHSAADGETIRKAAEAGARLSTHLGNGIEARLARHPNPIWDQAANDALSASVIADGHHVGLEFLRVVARAKGPERLILVSDFSPLAGLPEGTYGEWAIDPEGKVVVAGTPYLAGANQGLDVGLTNLLRWTDLTVPQSLAAVSTNPARLLGREGSEISEREPANLVLLRIGDRGGSSQVRIVETWVDGQQFNADSAA